LISRRFLHAALALSIRWRRIKSLFASFSSEKEDSFLPRYPSSSQLR
jgi:hypothetical protein